MAQEIVLRESTGEAQTGRLIVPFAFYNDTIGLSVGATFGGRGFPQPYSAEYRHIPTFNPLKDRKLLRKLNAFVDWLQWVGFVEVGRVADQFDVGELHQRMKLSGGLGLRFFANHLVIRAELAVSDEDARVLMSVNHPF